MTVSALYIDPLRGPYPALLGEANCYGVGRDATKYRGPGPVVAHPPCAHWSRLKALATAPDMHCGPIAVRQVRRIGRGVLEHPADSSLWRFCGLPRPGELSFDGTFTLEVEQVRWGHKARKRTWLWFVGVDRSSLPPVPPHREATHCVDDGAARLAGRPARLPSLKSWETHLTPPTFARWLVKSVAPGWLDD